jgi:hypothetical protein
MLHDSWRVKRSARPRHHSSDAAVRSRASAPTDDTVARARQQRVGADRACRPTCSTPPLPPAPLRPSVAACARGARGRSARRTLPHARRLRHCLASTPHARPLPIAAPPPHTPRDTRRRSAAGGEARRGGGSGTTACSGSGSGSGSGAHTTAPRAASCRTAGNSRRGSPDTAQHTQSHALRGRGVPPCAPRAALRYGSRRRRRCGGVTGAAPASRVL